MGLKSLDCFEYNLPIQAYRNEDGTINILNYRPRKHDCVEMPLSELKENPNIDDRDFFYGVSAYFLNLAFLFAEFADKKREAVYYHDEDLDKHFYPSSWEQHLINHKILSPPQGARE